MSYLFLLLAGAVGGFLSGLLGIGGGIVMFPMLLYLPPVFGLDAIGVKPVTGLTMMQGFVASLFAMLFYRKEKLLNMPLVFAFGVPLFLSSLAGSLVSKQVPDGFLVVIFGVLALCALALMLIPRQYSRDDMLGDAVVFNKPRAVGIALVTGVFLGMVGQGGAFIIIPLLLYLLNIPLRVALGSTLAIGLFSATAGTAGKLATGQIPLLMAAALTVGTIPMTRVGGMVSKKSNTKLLRWLLVCLILVTAVKVWTDVLMAWMGG